MKPYPYLNAGLPLEERLDDLTNRLKVDEKIGQLVKVRAFQEFNVGPDDRVELTAGYREFSRRYGVGSVYGLLRSDPWTGRDFDNGTAGDRTCKIVEAFDRETQTRKIPIPLLKAEEAPHGLAALGATEFPCGLAIGAAFEPELARRIGLAVGREALACGVNTVYAPILDLAVDPRWSRVEECYGEDPELVSRLAAAAVEGLRNSGVLPILKHFVGGGASEGGLNQNSAYFGPVELHNRHLRPFRRCIAAGARALMATYHDIDAEPCSGSRYLLTDLLRGELGFDGFVIADGGAVELLYHRRLARTLPEAAVIPNPDMSVSTTAAGCCVRPIMKAFSPKRKSMWRCAGCCG